MAIFRYAHAEPLDRRPGRENVTAFMQTKTLRFPSALFLSVCFSLAAALPSHAGEPIKFPTKDPAFTVELPAGWTSKPDKDGNLDCSPGGDSAFFMTILALPDVHTTADLKVILPTVAKSMADGAKLKDFELGDIDSDKNGNDIAFTGIRGDGKVEGVDFVVLVHAFEAQKGKFFAIMTAAPEKDDSYNEKDYDAITASIEAIK